MTTPTFAVGDRVTFNATKSDRAYGDALDDLTQFNGSTGTIGRDNFDTIVGVIWDADQAIVTAGTDYTRPSGRACFTANLLPLVEPAPSPKVGDVVEYQNVRSGTSAHNGARGVVKSITGAEGDRVIQINWITYPYAYAPPRFPFPENFKVVSPADILKDAAADLAVDLPGDIDLPALRERLLAFITPNLDVGQTERDAITIARAYERYITTGATS